MEISACTFVSSFYLMYFVFISYVYLYNVLHYILNKSRRLTDVPPLPIGGAITPGVAVELGKQNSSYQNTRRDPSVLRRYPLHTTIVGDKKAVGGSPRGDCATKMSSFSMCIGQWLFTQ